MMQVITEIPSVGYFEQWDTVVCQVENPKYTLAPTVAILPYGGMVLNHCTQTFK